MRQLDDPRESPHAGQDGRPVITFVIPCYNSADYMDRCISSIVDVVEEGMAGRSYGVEVLVIDDGSTDDGATAAHAREWEERHPGFVRAIRQENGGPGEAINTGLAQAHGTYFKVVDSDDWLDGPSLRQVLDQLGAFCAPWAQTQGERPVDALVCNYVYEHTDGTPPRTVRYHREFPQGRPFAWEEMLRPFPLWRYLMMHSVIWRTDMLRACDLHLPEHTFYVDEIVVYVGMAHARTLMYLDVDLYRYLIGRADQSVNEEIMSSRCDQQVRVARIKIDAVDVANAPSRSLRRYLTHDLTITMCFCTVFTTLSRRPDHLELRDDIWTYLREHDEHLWRHIRWSFIGWWCNLRSPAGVRAFEWGYRTVRDYFKFN